MNATFELWSKVLPERALACSFNLEYLLVGGWDRRPGYDRQFMWYDWMVGGWGGRNGKDGEHRDRAGLRRRTDDPAAGGAGAADAGGHHPPRDSARLGWSRQIPGWLSAWSRAASSTQNERSVMSYSLRPRAVDHLRHRGRSARLSAWRVAQSRQAGWQVPRRHLLRRAGQRGGRVRPALAPAAVASATRSSAIRRSCSRTSSTTTSRSSARARTTASSSSAIDPENLQYEIDVEATERERGEIRAKRQGWLRRGPGVGRRTIPRWRDRSARHHSPLRSDHRPAERSTPAQDDGAVSGDAATAHRGPLELISEAGMDLTDLERRIRALEDIEAIKQLKYRYADACDRGYDADTLADLFTTTPSGRATYSVATRGARQSVNSSAVSPPISPSPCTT